MGVFSMELFLKIINGFQQLTFFGKRSILDLKLGSKIASKNCPLVSKHLYQVRVKESNSHRFSTIVSITDFEDPLIIHRENQRELYRV